MEELPSNIGRYEILNRIAEGGMAEVFLGRSTGEGGFERLVAVKRILPSLTNDETFISMFVDEARISAGLVHSNIGQVFEFGRDGDTFFLAMEYIKGVPLRRLYGCFNEMQMLPPIPMTAYLMANVCAALDYAHTARDSMDRPLNIVHRDLSPKNIMVTFDGEVKLIDFGLAKAKHRMNETTVGVIKGKFAYMSPEQAFGEELDRRADIFSTGIVLYELLTSANPFETDDELTTLKRVRKARVPPPSSVIKGIPPKMEQICLRALARSPDDRYSTAVEMQADLEALCFEAGYGRRQLREWIEDALSEEMDRSRELLSGPTTATPTPESPPPEESDSEEEEFLSGPTIATSVPLFAQSEHSDREEEEEEILSGPTIATAVPLFAQSEHSDREEEEILSGPTIATSSPVFPQPEEGDSEEEDAPKLPQSKEGHSVEEVLSGPTTVYQGPPILPSREGDSTQESLSGPTAVTPSPVAKPQIQPSGHGWWPALIVLLATALMLGAWALWHMWSKS